jgi:hypothetical protein
MSATNAFETSLLNLIFNNSNIANIGDATGLRAAAAAGSLYVSLHTADPGELGTQNTSETAYTGYARVAVARTSAGWTVTGNNASNTAAVTWPLCTAAPGASVTHFGIGTAATGAGDLLFKGTLTSAYAIAVSNAPSAAAGELDVNYD